VTSLNFKYLFAISFSFVCILPVIQAKEIIPPDSAYFITESSGLNSLFTDDYRINPDNDGNLFLSIDNLNFFWNTETDGDIFKGYTLPGFRLMPRIIYFPASMIKLEAGMSLLRFWGADKYPCYTYQDIAEWKADDYQYGFHMLPFFRAQIQPVKQINVVLGNIYGGSNHKIIEPLFNPNLDLTADPECGLQFLYLSKTAKIDIWTNWESFIFKNDTHKEGLTFGVSAALNVTPENSFFHVNLPVQLIGVHRGGEIDDAAKNLTTMYNATSGLKFQFNTNRLLKKISLQLMGAYYKCIQGYELPYMEGWGLYSNLTAEIWNLKLKAAWWRSDDFINIFGNPVYENVSIILDGRLFPNIDVLSGGFKYEQPFGNGFYLGGDLDIYYNPNLIAFDPAAYGTSEPSKVSKSFNCSFGVYLRINPSIILKKKH
jgi:hypothetical protein